MQPHEKSLRIALVDFYSEGHHQSYIKYLACGLAHCGAEVGVVGLDQSSASTSYTIIFQPKDVGRLKKLKGWRRQLAFFYMACDAISAATKWDATHIHFVYADWHLAAIAAAWFREKSSAKLVLTIHWATSAGVDAASRLDSLRRYPHRAALWWLAQRFHVHVLVHHEELAASLSRIVKDLVIDVVPYPSEKVPEISVDACQEFRALNGIGRDCILLLCFGGTRYDKGVDLAVACLEKLPDRFHLLIAGQPLHFQAQDLLKMAKDARVENRLHFIASFIPDKDAHLIFNAADVVLLPYRNTFSGQSGPLVQAASLGRPVISADLPVLAHTLRAFSCGRVFLAEDIEDMAQTIQSLNGWRPRQSDTDAFNKHHAPQSFANIIYSMLLEGCH